MNSMLTWVATMRRRPPAAASSKLTVCMHLQAVARTDPRVMREATALVAAGFDVVIVDIEEDGRRDQVEVLQGVQLRHVMMPSWYVSTRFPWSLVKAARMCLAAIFRLLQIPAESYHAHDAPALIPCYIAARLRRKPLVLDAHELPLATTPLEEMSVNQRTIFPLLTWLFTHMMPYCRAAIATSAPMARAISMQYRLPVAVVRNFPPFQAATRSDRLRHRLGLGPEVRIALYQGNIQPDRQLDRLVHAAALLDGDIVIVLMGAARDETRTGLERLIAQTGVDDRVKILPPVPYTELLDWTASADVGLNILPVGYSAHLDVCLPNKVFEYLMAGLPVLASPLAAVVDIVTRFDVGSVVESLEPAAIATALKTLLADQEAMARMRRNALSVARKEFHWEQERLHLITLYRRLLPRSQVVPFGSPLEDENVVSAALSHTTRVQVEPESHPHTC